MDTPGPTVLLVDDDKDVREALARLLRSVGWNSRSFASAQEFINEEAFSGLGCVVLDVSMPGMSGPELHDWMRTHDCQLPVVFLSGTCDVPMSVAAIKAGAVDVLEKPADDEVLLKVIGAAIERHRDYRERHRLQADGERRLAELTRRERQVLMEVSHGRLNKQIASDLGISVKTVKVHRANGMRKMGVRGGATLVHLCEGLPSWQ